MALEGFNRRRSVRVIPQTASPLYDSFTFDVTTSMSISYPTTVTSHPVQNGETFADDIIIEPPIVSVSGILANTPARSPFGIPPLGITDQLEGERAIALLDLIRRIQKDKLLVTVLTSWLPELRDRVVETIDAERGVGSGNTIGVTLAFKKFRIVELGLVASVVDSDIVALGEQTVEIGTVSTTPVL